MLRSPTRGSGQRPVRSRRRTAVGVLPRLHRFAWALTSRPPDQELGRLPRRAQEATHRAACRRAAGAGSRRRKWHGGVRFQVTGIDGPLWRSSAPVGPLNGTESRPPALPHPSGCRRRASPASNKPSHPHKQPVPIPYCPLALPMCVTNTGSGGYIRMLFFQRQSTTSHHMERWRKGGRARA